MESRAFIAAEQTRENVAFGTLATPDEAEVVLAKEGLIGIAYQAAWKPSATNGARAALFVDGVQLSIASGQENERQETGSQHAEAGNFGALFTTGGGLRGRTPDRGGFTPAATGQIVGFTEFEGGAVMIPAAAGAHIITVQFKAVSGLVAVKNRKLVIWGV
jgi:hypothetical protein